MEQKKQAIAGDVVVLSGAVICGDVSIASGSSVWLDRKSTRLNSSHY